MIQSPDVRRLARPTRNSSKPTWSIAAALAGAVLLSLPITAGGAVAQQAPSATRPVDLKRAEITLSFFDALNRGDAAAAAAVFGENAFYSGASFIGALYPVYVRGLAYSRMGRHREAAAEFQKILDHPGITLNDPIGPMARLQLARALSASGDRAKSAAVYKDLLAIWKDADGDLPVVRDARAESAKRQ